MTPTRSPRNRKPRLILVPGKSGWAPLGYHVNKFGHLVPMRSHESPHDILRMRDFEVAQKAGEA